MAYSDMNMETTLALGNGCDVKIWSEECLRSDFATGGEKYLCTSCGKIASLDHEIRHEIFPYVSGDYDNLS